MTFIDWSDPEEMFGLLLEYVTDERAEADDSERRVFLSRLLKSLAELEQRFATLEPAARIDALRRLHRDAAEEAEDDPVVEHLEACADELERLSG